MSLSEFVTQVYKEKGISGRCEACGHTDWGISEELENLSFVKLIEEENLVESMSPVPVLVMTCNHCGNMRIHAKKILWS